MAGVRPIEIVRRHYVVDTGYLDELLAIDHRSNKADRSRVMQLFALCVDRGDELYVPFPVLFEVARHIVEVKSHEERKRLADLFHHSVTSSVQMKEPWVILGTGGNLVPESTSEVLIDYCDRFARNFPGLTETLTDVSVIREAHKLHARLSKRRDRRHLVHIWTRDKAVKANEPDREESPFV